MIIPGTSLDHPELVEGSWFDRLTMIISGTSLDHPELVEG
jgi:hypothetical protein